MAKITLPSCSEFWVSREQTFERSECWEGNWCKDWFESFVEADTGLNTVDLVLTGTHFCEDATDNKDPSRSENELNKLPSWNRTNLQRLRTYGWHLLAILHSHSGGGCWKCLWIPVNLLCAADLCCVEYWYWHWRKEHYWPKSFFFSLAILPALSSTSAFSHWI